MTTKRRTADYFIASVIGAAASFLTLPLSTRILGPEDYGAFALANVVLAVAVSLSILGISYIVHNRVASAPPMEANRYLGAALTVGLITATAAASVLAALYLSLRSVVHVVAEIPPLGAAFSLLPLFVAPIWNAASDLVTLEGRSRVFLVASVAQATLTAGTLLFALFVLELGRSSLFIGNATGYVALGAVALVVLRRRVDLKPGGAAFKRHLIIARKYVGAQLGETSAMLLERGLLANLVGLSTLGLYSHAARYRDYAAFATKSVTRAIWPVSLEEAMSPSDDFPVTARAWRVVQLGLAAGGVIFATVGDVIIGLLTNDKFTPAFTFAAAWFIVAITQNLARPALATVYAMGEPEASARPQALANVLWMAGLLLLVPPLGAWGAIAATLIQQAFFRWAIRRRALRHRPIGFHDRTALAGAAIVTSTLLVKLAWTPTLTGSSVLLAVSLTALVTMGRGDLLFVVRLLAQSRRLGARARPHASTVSTPEVVAGDQAVSQRGAAGDEGA